MIDGINKGVGGGISLSRASVERIAAPAKAAGASRTAAVTTSSSLYADLAAAAGPPIDVEKVRAIRTAIAEGRYPVDPDRIAKSMMDLDLPTSFQA